VIMDLELPAERDLPPGRAAGMKARLRAGMRGPARRPRTRLALAGAVTMAVAAAAAAPLLLPEESPTTIAMGPGELSPSLSEAVDDCLYGYPDKEMFQHGPRFPVTPADLAVAVEHDGDATAVFLTDRGYVACQYTAPGPLPDSEPSGGFSIEEWNGTRDWLPGPVQILQRTSSETDGGWVSAAGRISPRVKRVAVEHGGEVVEARIAGGTFGLLSTSDVGPDAALVAYAADGAEIWRQPFFRLTLDRYQCYADPDGKVVHPGLDRKINGKSGIARATGRCLPAEPWQR
jgi:hypothetical protein